MTIRPFTPSQEAAEELDRRTVGRDNLLAILDERLRQAATTKSRPHTLLVGSRGSGKTHLLRVALHRAMTDPVLSSGLAFALIPEDAIGLTSYVDLLQEAARALGLSPKQERDPAVLEEVLLEEAGSRTLVLVIENLDRVFDALGVNGQGDLRSWVETSGRVLLLAATPSLFKAVRDRGKPWFGGLIEMPLEGLSAEEGRDLLVLLAKARNDQALTDALQTERGRARIEAVSQLTGGSPRIWMVFSECLTVENLDELIPAVEGLVEGLVPYYQSLLWDLSGNQQAIVRQLAEGPTAAMTASEIAERTGLSEQTVSKTLGLLKESRWVRDRKPETDKRRTFYELREPMLRHHFQWRATQGEPLRLIVDLLRNWFEPHQLRSYLAQIDAGAPSESYLLESLRSNPDGFDSSYSIGTPEALRESAREWLHGADPVYSADTGLYAELCAELAINPDADVNKLLQTRQATYPQLTVPSNGALHRLTSAAAIGSPLSDLLRIAAEQEAGNLAASLYLLAAGFAGYNSPKAALDLLDKANPTVDSVLALAISLDRAFWLSEAGDTPKALRSAKKLLEKIEGKTGPDSSLTLTARSNIADYIGETGNPQEALKLYERLLPDREKVLGLNDRDTLITRSQIAYYTGQTGSSQEALTLLKQLLTDSERIIGSNDPLALSIRRNIRFFEDMVADSSGITALLEKARSGDSDAWIRLPAELRPLAESPTSP